MSRSRESRRAAEAKAKVLHLGVRMMEDVIRAEMEWVLKNYGSDADERKNPGSKVKYQCDRVAEFVRQWQLMEDLMRYHKIDLIGFHSIATKKGY